MSGYGSADAKHHKLETDPATSYIRGRFEAEIEIQSSLDHFTQTIDGHAMQKGQPLGNSCAGIAVQEQLWPEPSMARRGEGRRSVGVDIEPGRPGKPIRGSTRRLMARCYH